MMRPVFRVCLFLLLCLLQAELPVCAQVRQAGKVTLQNSGRKPLSGVQVKAMGAVPASSDVQGNFSLHFNKARPGQMLLLDEVYKEGYELVNEQALKRWTVSSSRTLPIVMCPKGTLASAQEKYYEIGKSHNMARYAEACHKLEEQLKQNRLSVEQYNARLNEISEAYQKTMAQLEDYAYAMACYNRDDLDRMSVRALALVEQGKVDEALSLYEKAQLVRMYQGLEVKEIQAEQELESMLPSLRLNADICLFAGGEENIGKARDIYEAIAWSDTTNASYAYEYAEFLTGQLLLFEEAKPWLLRALRHTTDQLQRAELYSGLGMITTYTGELKQSLSYLAKAEDIYNELVTQEDYKNDAYFNMACATCALNEGRFWHASKQSINAFEVLEEGLKYAIKALQLQPEKFAYQFAFYANDLLGATNAFAVQYQQKTADILQSVVDFGSMALEALSWTDEKERIKIAQLKAGIYNGLSVVYANCGQTEPGMAYADSCRRVVEENEALNPVLFRPLLTQNLTAVGQNLYLAEEYEAAIPYFLESYQISKDLPYLTRTTLSALHALMLCVPGLTSDKQVMEYSRLAVDYMRAHPQVLAPKRAFDMYWIYIYFNAALGKDLPFCEEVMQEMLAFIQKEDTEKVWFDDVSYVEQLATMLYAMYRHHGTVVTDRKTKRAVLDKAIEIVGRYPDLPEMEINQQVIEALWTED